MKPWTKAPKSAVSNPTAPYRAPSCRFAVCWKRCHDDFRGFFRNLLRVPRPLRMQAPGLAGTMARPERLELPTYWFVASRSIQLSYGRT